MLWHAHEPFCLDMRRTDWVFWSVMDLLRGEAQCMVRSGLGVTGSAWLVVAIR